MLAQGLLDTMNSWQRDKVKALPDHAGTDQCGLLLSLGVGLTGYSCLGAALGDRCLSLVSSACQCWPFGGFWLRLAVCALLFPSAMSQHWCEPSGVRAEREHSAGGGSCEGVQCSAPRTERLNSNTAPQIL